VGKYKYYFRKPKGEITKDILTWLLVSGMASIALTSPFFLVNVLRSFQKGRKYNRKALGSAFYQLKRDGCLNIETRNKQIYISLTEKGRKKAGWMQVDSLKIKKPKKWDRKWRVLIFDISHEHRIKREALRGILKRLGFTCLQKSVWVYPFECRDEVELLKDFFGFTSKEIRLITAGDIGEAKGLRSLFKV